MTDRRDLLRALASGGLLAALPAEVSAQGSPAGSEDGVVEFKRFGARGNGQADDGPAFQRALEALKEQGGGVLRLGRGIYRIARPISVDRLSGVRIEGAGTAKARWRPHPATQLRFDTDAPVAWALRSAYGVTMHGLIVSYARPGFRGTLLSLDGPPEENTMQAVLENCMFIGEGRLTGREGAEALVSLNGVISSSIRDCGFANARCAILGIRPTFDRRAFSNVIRVTGCSFIGLGETAVRNPGEAWSLEGNTFEASRDGAPGALRFDRHADGRGVGCSALSLTGNWFGDAKLGTTDVWVDACGHGITVMGNKFGGGVGVRIGERPYFPYREGTTEGVQGVAVLGNLFDHSSTALELPATAPRATTGSVMFQGNVLDRAVEGVRGTLPPGAMVQGR